MIAMTRSRVSHEASAKTHLRADLAFMDATDGRGARALRMCVLRDEALDRA